MLEGVYPRVQSQAEHANARACQEVNVRNSKDGENREEDLYQPVLSFSMPAKWIFGGISPKKKEKKKHTELKNELHFKNWLMNIIIDFLS